MCASSVGTWTTRLAIRSSASESWSSNWQRTQSRWAEDAYSSQQRHAACSRFWRSTPATWRRTNSFWRKCGAQTRAGGTLSLSLNPCAQAPAEARSGSGRAAHLPDQARDRLLALSS